MNTTEEIMEAIRSLPRPDRQRLLSSALGELEKEQETAAAPPRRGKLLLAAADELDAGEILDPTMDREAIYRDFSD